MDRSRARNSWMDSMVDVPARGVGIISMYRWYLRGPRALFTLRVHSGVRRYATALLRGW